MACELSAADFARSFGTSVEELGPECLSLISSTNFQYTVLEGEARDRAILEALKRTDSDRQVIGAPERQDVWQRGWEENLRRFTETGSSLDTLVPQFIRPNQLVRLFGCYAMPRSPHFELDYLRVLRLWLFRKHFKGVDSVYEFGCGTGFNLVELAALFPGMELHGLDFVSASVELVDSIAKTYGWRMRGRLFDMTRPDPALRLGAASGVLTFGALEQLAGRFEGFLQFLISRCPSICVHIEPTVELYDDSVMTDYLAIRFHRKRGYTEGYLPRLQALAEAGVIELLAAKRTFFGSFLMEGYSYIVWRPRGAE